ncbi:MAG: hypothetical protein ACK4SY_09260 [Pyrobaculum sp.]
MGWLQDVIKARELITSGREFTAITHGGMAHMDDLLAAALLYSKAQAVYRLNDLKDILNIPGDVVLVDIGDGFRDRLTDRFVVLDHHGVKDPAMEPSSIIQVALTLDVKTTPLVSTLAHFVDLFDRFGPTAKRAAGPYGNSLNYALTRYFSGFNGAVRDRFLELVAEAYHAEFDASVDSLTKAFEIVEKLAFARLVDTFPKTFSLLRLMLQAVKDPTVALSKEAVEAGFGIDFGCYALAAVPELEPYVIQGLEGYFSDARQAAETALYMRYTRIITKDITAVAVEKPMSPTLLWHALQDLAVVKGPVFIVIKDVRTPGAYTVWRPPEFASVIDFRKLSGNEVVFKHAGGFLAVVKADSAEEAARFVLSQL